ncbi:hypothetical protein CRV24_002174 [Beauveria bassiana]|nr:hypothetical protein CRV24_002174 [Beauveria bassiana]KAH8717538.1 hypothetical protein HC256_002221 [Beauveria bassiana]
MSSLRSAVYVAPQIPFQLPGPGGKTGLWSPISCTLIYTDREAVLVDTPITIHQTRNLITWIEKIAPNRKLTYIYVTHGHGDHFFGIPVLLERFPDAVPVATPAVIRHMAQQVEEPAFSTTWTSRFPNGQIYEPQQPTVLTSPLPAQHNTLLLDGGRHELRAVEVGHSDTYDSTILWVPDLKLAVCGDVVYGQVHQMLFEANTRQKRQEWIAAIEKVEALRPAYVVAGHKQAEEVDGVWHLAATKKYIEDFGRVLAGEPRDAKELFKEMSRLYPDRLNPGALILSCTGAFLVSKEARL